MQCNVAIFILIYIVNASFVDDRGVALSEFRSNNGIPASTFYRHVRTLIQARIIARTSRDRYVIHSQFVTRIARFANVSRVAEYMRDYQPSLFEDEDYG